MDMESIILETLTQYGFLGVGIIFMTKKYFEHTEKNIDNNREDSRQREERLYQIFDKQSEMMEQQFLLLQEMKASTDYHKDMLNKLTDIQMLHTNRLDRIDGEMALVKSEVTSIKEQIIKAPK